MRKSVLLISLAWIGLHSLVGCFSYAATVVPVSGAMPTAIKVPVGEKLGVCTFKPINLASVSSATGVAYVFESDFGSSGDTLDASPSTLLLFEGSVPLGPAHALHSDIKNYGKGRYSHWSDGISERLYFSTSDNTDPRTNRRVYSYCVPEVPEDLPLTEVTITEPTEGSTVTGKAVNVTVNIPGDAWVTGVQFKLDKANIGPEATVKPYRLVWDSTRVADGTHELSAEIHDGEKTVKTVTMPIKVGNFAGKRCKLQPINLAKVALNSGYCYSLEQESFGTPADSGPALVRSMLRLFEGGSELALPHSSHNAIRTSGAGRFSHWNNGHSDQLFFSTSDNTDPRKNGRVYSYCIPEGPDDSPLARIAITDPAEGRAVTGKAVKVAVTVPTDAQITGVQFKVDNINIGPEATAKPYQLLWDSTGVADGTHQLSAEIHDGTKTVKTALMSIKVSNLVAKPCKMQALNIAKVVQDSGYGYLLEQESFGTPADAGPALTRSMLRLFEGNSELSLPHSSHAAIRTSGGGRFSHWNSGRIDQLYFSASDNSDPRSNGRVYQYCAPSGDVTPPAVKMTAPAEGVTLSGTAVTLSAVATDDVGVAGVQFAIDGNRIGTEDNEAPYEFVWDSTGVADGRHALSVVASDAAKNKSSALINIAVSNRRVHGCTLIPLKTADIVPDTGFSYLVSQNSFGTPSDTKLAPTRSFLRLFENDTELPLGHAMHKGIQMFGHGQYSHWNNGYADQLYFSTSDNTDPRSNNRTYSYCVP